MFLDVPYTTQLLGLNYTGFSRSYLRYRICFLFLLLIRYFSSERSPSSYLS